MLNLNRLQLREAGPTDNVGRSITHRRDAAPPPRWAQRSAWLAVLTTVPSGLWRMAMAVGIPVGASDQIRLDYDFPGWGTAYVFGITFVLVGLAPLTLGLVQRWGEVVPHWIPFVGARRVPPLAAVIPAGAGRTAVGWQPPDPSAARTEAIGVVERLLHGLRIAPGAS